MAYVKTCELVGHRVQLLEDVTTHGGERFLGGDVFVVVGLKRVPGMAGNVRRLELQAEEDGRTLKVWRRKVRLCVPWPPEEPTTVVDAVRVEKGQRFGVCPKCGKRGMYRCPRREVDRCRYCKRYVDSAP